MKIKEKVKRSPFHVILDLVIGFLCVVLVGTGIFAIQRFHEDWSFSYDADSFYYRLQDEDFGQMVEMYHVNEAAGAKADEELMQYYGVAKYFEAASCYKAFQESIYLEKMNTAKEQMGELNFVSETICEKLSLEIK